MSKSITIQEGGYGKNMTVDKLKTNLSEGGTCLWVPEDAVGLTTKHISENGTYPATEDGVYGYSVVYVNVPGGPGGPASDVPGSVIVGTDPEDGEEYAYETVDDGSGGTEVKKTLMPSGIIITTPPTKLSYTDGETIDFSGIVVKLRKASGDFYTDENYPDSVIPFAELTFPVTVAHAGGGGGGGKSSDLIPGGVPCAPTGYYGANQISITNGSGMVTTWNDGSSKIILFASDNPDASGYTTNGVYDWGTALNATYAHGGKTVYYGAVRAQGVASTESTPFIENTSGMSADSIAWTMIYGTSGGPQTVPVQWTPPASKFPAQKTRSTTFEINVTAGSGSGGTTVDDDGFSGNEGNF